MCNRCPELQARVAMLQGKLQRAEREIHVRTLMSQSVQLPQPDVAREDDTCKLQDGEVKDCKPAILSYVFRELWSHPSCKYACIEWQVTRHFDNIAP